VKRIYLKKAQDESIVRIRCIGKSIETAVDSHPLEKKTALDIFEVLQATHLIEPNPQRIMCRYGHGEAKEFCDMPARTSVSTGRAKDVLCFLWSIKTGTRN
jgi:CDGSH-type Zn-finger protein